MNFNLKKLFERIGGNAKIFENEHMDARLSGGREGGTSKITVKMDKNEVAVDVFTNIPHPLDENVLTKLNSLNGQDLYQNFDEAKKLWKLLVKKSIECLRYYDRREPFLSMPNKVPVVYGEEELNNYFESFVKFEALLYGSSPYYRDHVVHTLHVWKLGLEELLSREALMDGLKTELHKDIKKYVHLRTTSLEIISMWTVAALCHDLGYPLETARKIIDGTQSILNHFTENAQIPFSINFTGIQNEMNSIIVKVMSSRLRHVPAPPHPDCADAAGGNEGNAEAGAAPNGKAGKEKEEAQKAEAEGAENNAPEQPKKPEEQFLVRIQPKYFMKYATSLEHYEHGIISALILYKLLMYFKESEFAMNEDYTLDEEGARQFYIRREILRAISSHTCMDIYHMSSYSLPFLLHVCDDMQSWDRKNFRDMHASKHNEAEPVAEFTEYDDKQVSILDVISYSDFSEKDMESFFTYLCSLMKELQKRYRDGPDTKNRLFSFERKFTIRQAEGGQNGLDGLEVTLRIPQSEAVEIRCKIEHKFKGRSEDITKYIQKLNEQHPFTISVV